MHFLYSISYKTHTHAATAWRRQRWRHCIVHGTERPAIARILSYLYLSEWTGNWKPFSHLEAHWPAARPKQNSFFLSAALLFFVFWCLFATIFYRPAELRMKMRETVNKSLPFSVAAFLRRRSRPSWPVPSICIPFMFSKFRNEKFSSFVRRFCRINVRRGACFSSCVFYAMQCKHICSVEMAAVVAGKPFNQTLCIQ